MKVLLSWLREFAPLPNDADLIAEAFSDLGTPVEEQQRIADWTGIVVARVLDLRPHPNADKIQLVDVDAGQGKDEPLQICCGAFNMERGDLVPLATLGTSMPGGMAIERRKLRGEWSNGMLCSSRELGLDEDHGGIMLLPPGSTPGTDLGEALGIAPDVLFDLEVNPNRPDAMSVAGLARDLAARFEVEFSWNEQEVPAIGLPAAADVSVAILAPAQCGRFGAWVLRDVTVGESPSWMQRRLTALGMRPINSLVDISNYVMLETGQPNHPYDLALVEGGGLRVRLATNGELLTTLDDVQRTLSGDDLLICDNNDSPVGLAGIMGGSSCEISSTTTDVLLEMAWFQPMSISRTSRRLGLRSEASARFEKGCDPDGVARAAARFCELATEICGAKIAPGAVVVDGVIPPKPPVLLRSVRVNAILGTDLTQEQIRAALDPIGFFCAPVGEDHHVQVPTWRFDSATEIDVIEEVGRHWGYANIPRRELTEPRAGGLTHRQRSRRAVRRLMTGLGAAEAMPLPFLAPGDLARCGLDPRGIDLLNPMVAEESVLRTSLLPGLVAATAQNAARRSRGIALFEIGHIFLPPAAGEVLPDEREHLGVLLAGREAPAAVETWQILAELLRVESPAVENLERPGLHPTRGAAAMAGGRIVGSVGEIDPDVLADYGIEERVAYLEVDLGALLGAEPRAADYRPISRFPSSDMDLAFEVHERISATDVERTLLGADPIVWSVRLFDVYRGEPVVAGFRSLAYSIRLQPTDHTLTDDEASEVRARLVQAVAKAHGAELRGSS